MMQREDAAMAARFCDFLRGMLFAIPTTEHNADAIQNAQLQLKAIHEHFADLVSGELKLVKKKETE